MRRIDPNSDSDYSDSDYSDSDSEGSPRFIYVA